MQLVVESVCYADYELVISNGSIEHRKRVLCITWLADGLNVSVHFFTQLGISLNQRGVLLEPVLVDAVILHALALRISDRSNGYLDVNLSKALTYTLITRINSEVYIVTKLVVILILLSKFVFSQRLTILIELILDFSVGELPY